MSAVKVTLALLAGMAAGAAAGLLFAPQAGTETRDKLTDSWTNLGDSIKETASKQFDGLVESFKTKIADTVKSKFGDVLTDDGHADDLEHA